MSEQPEFEVEENEPDPLGVSPDTAQLVYILFLPAGLLFGVPAIIGVIMAYLNKAYAPDWLRSHYEFLINTFWKGFIILVASFLLLIAYGLGILVALAGTVWWIVRLFKGVKILAQKESIEDPNTWGFP